MRSQIKLGRIAGIEIGLHYSWFVIAFLIAFSLATQFRAARHDWSENTVWAAAIITAVLFFVTLLLHELAHSLVAKSRGLRVRSITLFALGGVSQIESEAPNARTEFWVAIVGPITSGVIGAVCIWSERSLLAAGGQTPASAVLLWLGYINVALAVFNLIPGYPLDGGRVLRAILWWISHSAQRATRWAAQTGQVVAVLLILYGLYRFFLGANFGGLWLAFIGWFLLDAARSSYVQFGIIEGLRGHSVGELMERNCPAVPAYLSLRDFVDEYLLHSASRCFLVTQDGSAAGLITPEETRSIPREDWPQTSVQSVMRPLNQLKAVPPEMPAVKALEMMSREKLPQVAVFSNGIFKGLFSPSQVARFLQVYLGEHDVPHNRAA